MLFTITQKEKLTGYEVDQVQVKLTADLKKRIRKFVQVAYNLKSVPSTRQIKKYFSSKSVFIDLRKISAWLYVYAAAEKQYEARNLDETAIAEYYQENIANETQKEFAVRVDNELVIACKKHDCVLGEVDTACNYSAKIWKLDQKGILRVIGRISCNQVTKQWATTWTATMYPKAVTCPSQALHILCSIFKG